MRVFIHNSSREVLYKYFLSRQYSRVPYSRVGIVIMTTNVLETGRIVCFTSQLHYDESAGWRLIKSGLA